jgi:hypothetical protein
MAKKKTKKAAKRKGRTAASTAAHQVTREELQDALVCTIGGEASLRFVEVYLTNPTKPAQEFVISAFTATSDGSKAGHDEETLHILRDYFVQNDYEEMPYSRVVGRIIDVLLNHRGHKTCSGGDVFYVLLDETPDQSGCDPKDYELMTPTKSGRWYDVDNNAGRKNVDNRLKGLKEGGWVTLPRKKGYVLTTKGRLLFDGWPDLAEIPGLKLMPPPRPTT